MERSGAISHTFIEQVAELLKEVYFNPQLLIEGLREGRITGFRQNKTEQLVEFLTEEGYIDPRPVLEIEEIQLRLNAFVSAHEMDAGSSQIFLEQIQDYKPN